MKKVILFLTLILALETTRAQSPYQPIEFHNAAFAIQYGYYNVQSYGYIRYEKYESDTVVNSLNYAKFKSYIHCLYSSLPNCGFMGTLPPYYYTLYRNDTLGKKVYRWYEGQFNENLVCDFSLQVGDMLSLGFTMRLDSIDSVQVNNVWHRRFHFKDTVNTDYFTNIEGLGIINKSFLSGTEKLLCYAVNDNIIWHPDTIENCYVPLNIMEAPPIKALVEFSDNTLHISNASGVVYLFELSGQTVLKENVVNHYSKKIDSHLHGIYLLKFISNNYQETRKIWIE